MNLPEITSFLKKFPLCNLCFSTFLLWLEAKIPNSLENNDLIIALQEKDFEKLNILETIFQRSQHLLGLSDNEFVRTFNFDSDLLTFDNEKFHNLLTKPILVVNMHDAGFTKITKLPTMLKNQGAQFQSADFTAERHGRKYAIELATVRMENKPHPDPEIIIDESFLPYWWGRMLRNNLFLKIEDKNQSVIKQLSDTKEHLSCDCTMLAFYTRRIGPSTLMESNDYVKEIIDVKERYEKIDYIFFKDYFGQISVIPY